MSNRAGRDVIHLWLIDKSSATFIISKYPPGTGGCKSVKEQENKNVNGG